MRLVASACLGLLLWSSPIRAEGQWVEGVVAVVGGKPLLASQLRKRAEPVLQQLRAAEEDDLSREQQAQVYEEVLEEMVERRLVALEATRRAIAVTADEIETAIARAAADREQSVEEWLDEAMRGASLDADAVRAEIGSQLLEAKVVLAAATRLPSDEAAKLTALQKAKHDLLRASWKRFGVEVRVTFR